MSRLVAPHGGGELTPLLLEGDELKEEKKRAKALAEIKMSSRETSDLIMMGMGAFTPIDGFMGKDDWQGVCDEYTLVNGVFGLSLSPSPPQKGGQKA